MFSDPTIHHSHELDATTRDKINLVWDYFCIFELLCGFSSNSIGATEFIWFFMLICVEIMANDGLGVGL